MKMLAGHMLGVLFAWGLGALFATPFILFVLEGRPISRRQKRRAIWIVVLSIAWMGVAGTLYYWLQSN